MFIFYHILNILKFYLSVLKVIVIQNIVRTFWILNANFEHDNFFQDFCKLIQKLSKYFLQKQSFVVDIQQPKLIINLFQRSKTSDKKLTHLFHMWKQ